MPSLHAFAKPKTHFLFACALSLGLSGCGPLLDLLKPALDSGSRTTTRTDATGRAVGESVAYVKGDLAGQDFTQMSASLARTTAALLQAILTTNSFLYTDNQVTSLETFQLRKTEADKALSVLEASAAETESILSRMDATMGSQALQIKAAQSLRPEDVLATVSSGPANKQLKTLMQQYQVNAKTAKEILDNAMTGLSSQYNKQAEFYNTAARTATLVKEGAGLSLTVLGGVVTAGGVTGTLSVLQAGKLLITGADAAIKVSKAGVELITGKDLKQPTGTVGAVLTTVSDATEIIGFTDLFNWKDKADRIANVVNISLKANDVIQDGELNLGAHTLNLTQILRDLKGWIPTEIPFTLPGSYQVAGKPVVVKTLPDNLKQVIQTLPATQRVDQTKISAGASPTSSPVSSPVPSPTSPNSVVDPNQSASTGYKAGWCEIPITIEGATLNENTWTEDLAAKIYPSEGAEWTADATSSKVAIHGTINCEATSSEDDYGYSIRVTAMATLTDIYKKEALLSRGGGSKSFDVTYDFQQEKNLLLMGSSIKVEVRVHNPEPKARGGSIRRSIGYIKIAPQ